LNTFIIETVVGQNWLTEDQILAVQQAVAQDPSLSAIDFLSQQGWLGPDHITWLQQVASHSTQEHNGDAQPVQEATTVDVVEESAPKVFSGVKVKNSPLPPPSSDIETILSGDGALLHLNDYLKLGQHYGASDVHIGVNCPPMMRRHGCLQTMWANAPKLSAAQTERLLMEFITEEQKAHFKELGDLDFCYSIPELGRFRSSVVRQRLGIDGVFRIINTNVKSMDEIGLPQQLKGLTKYHNGLILVTGSVGSGKSTTLAAFVDEINKDRHDHIITLEDPIEYVFKPKTCQITQREVRTHTESFGTALRAALREDPDVIMVGEMRDLETISLAITASETGHLVLGTLHTGSAARTMDRILDVFPVEQQAQIRTMVSGSLRGVISQQLVPLANGQGRALALEILINTPASAALIRDGKTFMLPGVIQTGKKLGCRMMDDSLMQLMENEIITPQDAFDRAEQKAAFRKFLVD
jgi:twitching motility protein PilT